MKPIFAFLASVFTALGAVVPFDIAGPGPGSITVSSTPDAAVARAREPTSSSAATPANSDGGPVRRTLADEPQGR